MADKLDPERRSENMRRIRSKDTSPELTVRRELRALGHTGYRLHRKELPGKPDIAFLGQRKAILIHGCFGTATTARKASASPRAIGNTGCRRSRATSSATRSTSALWKPPGGKFCWCGSASYGAAKRSGKACALHGVLGRTLTNLVYER